MFVTRPQEAPKPRSPRDCAVLQPRLGIPLHAAGRTAACNPAPALTVEARSRYILCASPTEPDASSLNLTLISPLCRAACYHGEPGSSLPLSFNSGVKLSKQPNRICSKCLQKEEDRGACSRTPGASPGKENNHYC